MFRPREKPGSGVSEGRALLATVCLSVCLLLTWHVIYYANKHRSSFVLPSIAVVSRSRMRKDTEREEGGGGEAAYLMYGFHTALPNPSLSVAEFTRG